MKLTNIFSRVLAIFGLVFIFSISGWGACTGTNQGNWASGTTYSSNNFSNDYYALNVTSAGTIDFSITNNSSGSGTRNVNFTLYQSSNCSSPIASGTTTLTEGQTITPSVTVSTGTYTLQLSRTSGSTSKYSWSGTFALPPAPVISAATFSVNENSSGGTSVGTVSTSNSPFTNFTLTNTDNTPQSLFDIDLSGNITVHAGAVLNYEAISSYTLKATATNGVGSSSANITINLNNIAGPTITSGQTFTTYSGSTNGTSIGLLAVTIPTPLPSGNTTTAYTSNDSAFAISNTGAITVADSSMLSLGTHTVTVTATNAEGSSSATIAITVNTPPKNLSIAMNAPTSTFANSAIQYDINVTNNETTTTVDNLKITDTFTNATYQGAYGEGWSCTNLTNTVTCTYSSLSAGQTTTPVHIIVLPTGTSTVSSTATAVNSSHSPSSVTKTTTISGSATGDRNFTVVYSTNDTGNIKIIGNSVLQNPGGCNSTANNGVTSPTFANVDSSNSAVTINSTSAQLALPLNVTSSDILYAGLYWQGRTSGTKSQSVKLRFEGDSSYNTITTIGSKYNVNGDDYQGVADVTSYLQNNVNTFNALNTGGQYIKNIFVADINTDLASNKYGAWSLIIVYRDTTEVYKNLVVYDGYKRIAGSGSTSPTTGGSPQVTVPITGFLTPSSGAVNSSFFIFGGEGDLGYGDAVSLSKSNGTTDIFLKYPNSISFETSATNHTATGVFEVFSSSETDDAGNNITTRNPSCYNTLGIDIHSYNVGTTGLNIIGNSQTSTTVKLSSFEVYPTTSDTYANMYDTYIAGMFAFTTDLYAPFIKINKTSNSPSGTILTPNQEITYTADLNNTGQENAINIVVYDNFDTNILNRIDGNVTSPTITLGDLLDHNTTKISNSITCKYGPSNINCASACSVTSSPFKVSCSIPELDINQTAKVTFKVQLASSPDTQQQSVNLQNKMYSTFNNWLTGAAAPQSSSNIASAGRYLYAPVEPSYADIIDTFTTNVNYNNGTDRHITTKIAAKTSQVITAVHLNSSNQAAPFTTTTTAKFSVVPVWSNDSCTASENVLDASTGTQVVLDIPNNASAISGNIKVKANAQKINRFRLIIADPSTMSTSAQNCINNSSTTGNLARVAACADSEHQYVDAFGQTAYDRCGNSSGRPCTPSNHGVANPNDPGYNPLYANELGCFMCTFDAANTCSSDNFAIRPNNFNINSTNTNYPNLLRAGQVYDLNVTAPDGTGVATLDYNQTNSYITQNSTKFLHVSSNPNTYAINGTGGVNLPYNGDINVSSLNFLNGLSQSGSSFKYADVGMIDMNITDQNWAAVDAGDTAADCSSTGRFICADQNITFIPDHFDFNTTMITNNTSGSTFTYLANQIDQMAARIQTTIRALNADGNVTQNFATAPLWENNVTVVPVVSVASPTPTRYFHSDANESNISNVALGFNDGNYTVLATETNSSKYLRFNFPRDVNQTANPFVINSSDLNMTVSSLYTQSVVGRDATANIQNIPLSGVDANATFVYGRTHAPRYRFTGNSGNALIYYENYCDANGNKALLPNGITSKGGVDSVGWYLNELTTIADGIAGTVSEKKATVHVNPVTITTFSAPAVSTASLHYDGALNYPYKTTMENNASSWLIYDKYNNAATTNEFEVEFYNSAVNWTGIRNTNTTTDSNATTTTNKRILW